MKPGPNDTQYPLLISGRELAELQRFTHAMAEAFGLDRRIENYQGKRPLRLYRWDLECLECVTAMALEDPTAYPDQSGKGYQAMRDLNERIERLMAQAFADIKKK